MLCVTRLWLGEFPYAGMLYFRFECVLYHCVLEDIMFVRLGSVEKLALQRLFVQVILL
jgi:hypothetical protein